MQFRNLVVVALLVVGNLSAAAGTLYIAPIDQSSLSAYSTASYLPAGGFLVGSQATALALSPDGKSAYVAASAEQYVAKFDVASGKLLQTFPVTSGLTDVGVSPDGSVMYALVNGIQSMLYSFNTVTGVPIASVSAGSFATALAVEPDGKKVYVAQSFSILDFDAASLQNTSSVDAFVMSLAFGPSPNTLYAATSILPGGVTEIDTATDQIINNTFDPGPVNALAVSPDGNSIFTATFTGLVQQSAQTLEIVNTFDASQTFLALAVSPDGSTVLGVDGPLVAKITLADDSVRDVAVNGLANRAVYSPDGGRVYILLETAYDLDYADESKNQVTGLISKVRGNYLLAASATGNKVAGNNSGQLSIIDTASHTVQYALRHPGSNSLGGLALNSDGSQVFFPVGIPTSALEILTLASSQSKTVPIPSAGGDLFVVVSPDDTTAYVSSPLCAIDITSGTLKKCGGPILEAFYGAKRVLALDAKGSHVFAITSTGLTEFDAITLQALRSVSLPNVGTVGIAYSEIANSVYVIAQNLQTAGSSVFRIDLSSFTVADTAALTLIVSDIAVSADGKKVYVPGDELGIPVLDGTTLSNLGTLGKVGASSVVTAN